MQVIHDKEKIIEIGHGDVSRFEGQYSIEKGNFDIPKYDKLIELRWNGSEVVKRDSKDPVLEEQKREDILKGQTHASIAEIDTSRSGKKYLKVEKTIDGKTYSVWAYVDYSLLLAYQNNALKVGDIVIIEFVDNDLDKAYAQGKVVGF